jgi:hypothetical protein
MLLFVIAVAYDQLFWGMNVQGGLLLFYYYYLLQLGFHPVAVVLTLVHTIQMDI